MKLHLLAACFSTTVLALSAGSAHAEDAKSNVSVVLAETVDVVEPCMAARQDVGRVISENVNEMLVEFDYVNGGLKPRLATEWSKIDDDTWEFKLRPNVKWHDGKPFTAKDVQFTIERNKNKKLSCETGGKYFGGTEFSFETPDANTIRITTKPAQPILPLLMSVMAVEPADATPANEFTRKPIGTGPYTFDKWDIGQSIVLKRNPEYWGEKPQVEQATYLFRSDSAVAAAMVDAGEADIVPAVSVQDATNKETDFAYPNSETTSLRIDTRAAPLNDRRIREAMNLAIDRQAMLGTLFPEQAKIATQLVVPTTIGYNADIPTWPYDPEKAKELVAAAKADGVPVDREIRIIGRNGQYPNATEAMEAIMAMLQDVGLNVKLDMYDVSVWNGYFVAPFVADSGPTLTQSQHDNATGDPVFTAFVKYATDGSHSMVRDPAVDALIAKATSATGDERTKLWKELFAKVNTEIIADIPMFHMVGFTRVSPRLDFKPTIATNSELQLSQIRFK
ncbi:ABC transporter substrate-binding protein [Rhizobium ruizarguesonis]|uniref:ABC transporter substrate-binding protein n=1 Tax=Rhizobium ruizarguesonis TaxID=2081791 RepID=UPI0010300D5D|nr:ABC transporter substrate-binding protein [Rhizobium ruizarguesonis]NKL11878.1 peptide ABC transporter substrate-binding protein [Rhizobium leguminosarum bv. viciae]NEI10936.1 peptide ABC transporter substrate-binding protein [Rhizobium ruizarguesonis]NEI97727.1 peptide ABC transporter substrate-binding protein [Rhizobium ruizarguesonis]NEJ34266.1 peptide ABC transporter substrate-binding protein [Rhizobium ruizarguesonis]TAV01493.1 peptide ABC transporter substrate-binding protein [Rhizobi